MRELNALESASGIITGIAAQWWYGKNPKNPRDIWQGISPLLWGSELRL